MARSHLNADHAIDAVIHERVRSALGRAVSHPRAIKVEVERGTVRLRGSVLEREHAQLLRAVRSVRGVDDVSDDQLAIYSRPTGVPELQGGPNVRRSSGPDLMQEHWAPGTRLMAGGFGAALMLGAARQIFNEPARAALGASAIAAGSLLLIRSAMNVPLRRLVGLSGRRAIDIHKTLHVHAPVDEVFETLANYQNFPAFMRNVRDVRMHEDGRSHWVVAGPGGVSVEWDAETTVHEPNELLAWRTVRDATVAHAGIIRFERVDSGTRLDIQMSYNPPAGALGHAVAKIFGSDAKTELDEDLLRLKSYLETGVRPRDAARRAESVPRPQPQPSEPSRADLH